jgi:hypothetical protein
MSSISSNPGAIRGFLNVRSAQGVTRRSVSADQVMMHAWSIGTTPRAGQPGERSNTPVAAEKKANRTENCPPEVYIG